MDVVKVREFIAKRTSNAEYRQDVLDGDYDDCGWFLHVAAALTPPEGYVLVPVEPTEAMLDAMYTNLDLDDDGLKELWRNALAARPEVP